MKHRLCPCCRLPAVWPARIHAGELDQVGVLLGLCVACAAAHDRLPAGRRHRQLSAAARTAAGDSGQRYWAAAFADKDAAQLAAGLIRCTGTRPGALEAISWPALPA